MKKLLTLTFLFGLAIAIAGFVWLTFIYPQSTPQRLQEVTLDIPRGTGGAAIAQKLADKQVISSPLAFRILARIKGESANFQAGEYEFAAGETIATVMKKLRDGEIVLRQVTIPEGKTSSEIVTILQNVEGLTGDIKTVPKEGSLLPDTYRYHLNETRQSIIDRMQAAQKQLLAEIWDDRQEGLPFTTQQEALTLASIVEKETGLASERPYVAGLYINRLHIGMLLQADPTVAYGVYGGQYNDKPLRRSDLKRDTPYNSYLHKGLPPTPICNAGTAVIKAVLNPAKHDDLFMVARGDGGHFFAKTNAQHEANVRKYRAWKKTQ